MSGWERYSKNLVSPWVPLKDEKRSIPLSASPVLVPRTGGERQEVPRVSGPCDGAVSSGFWPRESQRRANVGPAPHRLHLRDWHPHRIPGRGRPHPLYVRPGLLPSHQLWGLLQL